MNSLKILITAVCVAACSSAFAAEEFSGDSRKLAESIQRKAVLVKQAAEGKYGEARKLRQQAGIVRGNASAKSREILSRAEFNQGTAEFFGDIFNLLSNTASLNPTSGASFSRAQPTLSFLLNYQQKSANKESAAAQSQAEQLDGAADKQAMPMELRAQALEEEGNRLMDAYNKIDAISNAYYLLAASGDLKTKVENDTDFLEGIKRKAQYK